MHGHLNSGAWPCCTLKLKVHGLSSLSDLGVDNLNKIVYNEHTFGIDNQKGLHMRVTNADLSMMLISINNRLALNGQRLELRLEAVKSRKVTLYQIKTVGSGREISQVAESEEIYNVLTSLQRVLQIMGL